MGHYEIDDDGNRTWYESGDAGMFGVKRVPRSAHHHRDAQLRRAMMADFRREQVMASFGGAVREPASQTRIRAKVDRHDQRYRDWYGYTPTPAEQRAAYLRHAWQQRRNARKQGHRMWDMLGLASSTWGPEWTSRRDRETMYPGF